MFVRRSSASAIVNRVGSSAIHAAVSQETFGRNRNPAGREERRDEKKPVLLPLNISLIHYDVRDSGG